VVYTALTESATVEFHARFRRGHQTIRTTFHTFAVVMSPHLDKKAPNQ
jgi:hypothetical protein